MSLIRWTPRGSWLDLRNEFDRLFDNFFRPTEEEETALSSFWPAVDIIEEEKEYKVHAELPGLTKDDIRISVKDNLLSISGEKKRESQVREEHFQRAERYFGTFQRSFRLPEQVDVDKIEAEFKDGVLNIVIPKLKEALAKQIEVKVK